MIDLERESSDRIVVGTADFVAFCPFASRFPYETWIVPREHRSHFDAISSESIPNLAAVLQAVLTKLQVALDDPAYNNIIHTAPFHSGELEHGHWRLEILPRLTQVAGFELGTECFINTVAPESAAARLRQAEVPIEDAITTPTVME